MHRGELFKALDCAQELDNETAKHAWSGVDRGSGDHVSAMVEKRGLRLDVSAWRTRESEGRQETLKAVFAPIRPDSEYWELLGARVNGIPCPLRDQEATALFAAARAIAQHQEEQRESAEAKPATPRSMRF
jgi:hypothetical protein